MRTFSVGTGAVPQWTTHIDGVNGLAPGGRPTSPAGVSREKARADEGGGVAEWGRQQVEIPVARSRLASPGSRSGVDRPTPSRLEDAVALPGRTRGLALCHGLALTDVGVTPFSVTTNGGRMIWSRGFIAVMR